MFSISNIFIVVIIAICGSKTFCEGCEVIPGCSEVDIKNVITSLHNNKRLLLAQGKLPPQPRASNMKQMNWDSALFKAADKIAGSCKFAHQKVTDSRFYVGQNIFQAGSFEKIANWTQVAEGWWSEIKNYKYPGSYNPNTGHYTQMAWADSNLIGCGCRGFKSPQSQFYNILFVCNYGPGGNYANQAPYETKGNGCQNLC